MSKKYCITSAYVFAVIALLHAWRFFVDAAIVVGGWSVPRGLSAVGALAAAALSIWAFRSASVVETRTIVYS